MESFNISIDYEDVKCSICKNFLSVPPIIYTDSTGIICGRCNHLVFKQNTNPTIERQTLFEKLAENFEFPCIYKERGCEALLKWGQVSEHEASCEKKLEKTGVACEFDVKDEEGIIQESSSTCFYGCKEFLNKTANKCDWKGKLYYYFAHVEKSHADTFVDPPSIVLSEPYKSKFIFHEFSGILVVIVFEYDEESNTYYSLVFTEHMNQKRLMYEVKVLDEKRKPFISFPQKYSKDLPHNRKTMRQFGQEIKMSDICLIQDPKYILVDFISEDSKTLPIVEVDNRFNIPICENCAIYLTPPLYFCHKNHKFCNKCLEIKQECNRVKSRNSVLEQLLCYAQYTCDNLRCPYVGTFTTYELHKKICCYNAKKCPVKDCIWRRYDVVYHVKKFHKVSETNVYIPLSDNEEILLFVFDGNVFSLKINQQFTLDHTTIVKFKLICVGILELNYKYEVEITCPDFPHSRILFEHLVEPELYRFVNNEGIEEFTTSKVLKQLFPLKSKLQFKLNISAIDESRISESSK